MAQGTYYVVPERVNKAQEVFLSFIKKLSADDAAGILIEAGLGECVVWDEIDDNRTRFDFTDLQMVCAAAAVIAASEGYNAAPIPVLEIVEAAAAQSLEPAPEYAEAVF